MIPAQMPLAPPVSVTLRDGAVYTQRLITEYDAPALAEFYASVPRDDSRFYMGPSALNEAHAEVDAQEAVSPLVVALVLESSDGRIVAFSWYRWAEGVDQVSTFGICVRRGFQGIGAGEAMITRVISVAEHVGPDVMSLTVQKANLRAQKLYLKSGFQIVREQMIGERDGFDAEPEYYMERSVR